MPKPLSRLSEFLYRLSDAWLEFKRVKFGIAALILLVILISASLYVLVAWDYPKEVDRWLRIQLWVENPKTVPPCWFLSMTGTPIAETAAYSFTPGRPEISNESIEGTTFYEASIIHKAVVPAEIKSPGMPSDVRIKLIMNTLSEEAKKLEEEGLIFGFTEKYSLVIIRPDNLNFTLVHDASLSTLGNLTYPDTIVYYERFEQKIVKIQKSVSLKNIPKEHLKAVEELAQIYKGYNVTTDVIASALTELILSELTPEALKGEYKVLQGKYLFILTVNRTLIYDAANPVPELRSFISKVKDENPVREFKIYLLGNCFGFLGTDIFGRDVFKGVLLGVPWALIIGLSVAFLAIMIGAIYAVVAGYVGGYVEEVMLRVVDVINNLPALPLFIAIQAFIGLNIWGIIGLMVALYWTGPVLTIRAMVLQIKESTYIEAAKSIGAGPLRIIFRHILPQVLPYAFAIMALSVPSAILTEAGLSFLGLGDPKTPTWGKMLQETRTPNWDAAASGWWWWFIPPGLAIALVGTTFILLGRALETIYNPRLRKA
ncbi:MAG TPA: ABC transporter permease subunit [Acidilobales archaeon]|nr:ABC transporter permease subunit [Acidilobales archaeon]